MGSAAMYLGIIADDFTGGSDIALTLARGGLRVVQHVGVPASADALPEADAVVVSLKSRTIAAGEAVAQSLDTMRRLREAGARQLFFKYCSTFDSTEEGNIGPVADALREALEAPVVPFCPAFPSTRRTVYQGHLFVGDQLLSDSPMRDHPLTPMRDANLVRFLQRQTATRVGMVPFATVDEGAAAIRAAYARAAAPGGTPFVVVDALTDRHLHAIGHASADLPLITGGSGVAIGLPENIRAAGALRERDAAEAAWQAPAGARAILAGSCSAATRQQLRFALDNGVEGFRIEPRSLADPAQVAEEAAAWVRRRLGTRPVVVYSSADPDDVRSAQAELGTAVAGERVERCLAATARLLVEAGARQIIVAGGETSGAVVAALGVVDLEIGPEIDPGVPWMVSRAPVPIALALKSGNFGSPEFFVRAWERLSTDRAA